MKVFAEGTASVDTELSTQTILEVDRLVAGYGNRPVATLPQLQLRAGESALLLGVSGSGKTTLLLAIAGLAQVISGHARVKGESLDRSIGIGTDRRRGQLLGFVFQDIHLIGGLSVLDNVLLSAFAVGVKQDRRRATSLLGAMGLGDLTHRPAQALSRGQAQRVSVARAMLLRPCLILADEPTASLDDEACEAVASLLETAMQETGAALLIATHDQRLRRRFRHEIPLSPIA